MCGISGYFFHKEILDQSSLSLEKASSKIEHRGPDDSGIFYDFEKVVGLAHQRLSIIDTSKNGHQPMISEDQKYVIVFNGEIYNFEELRNFLNEKKKINWKGNSDTEVLLNFYIYIKENNLGEETFFNKLNGIFSMAIWSKENKELIISRDSFGVKPLYYFLHRKGISFSSEIKGLMELIPKSLVLTNSEFNELDLDAINKYLTFLWCPGNSTPNKFVRKLNPGQFVIISNDFVPKFKTWYEPPIFRKNKYKHNLKRNDFFKKTEFFLRQAVHRQMVSDVPLGAFLSGGLDSSSVVNFAKEKNPNISCFTIELKGGVEKGFVDDLYYAKKVSKFLNVPLDIISVDADTITSSIEDMVWQLDEPLADPAALNVFFISKLARKKGIKVMLSGNGGDDIFTGYRRHFAASNEFLLDYIPSLITKRLSRLSFLLSTNNFYSRRIRKYLSGISLDKSSRLINYFRWIGREDLMRLYSKNFLDCFSNSSEEIPMKELLNNLPSDVDNIDRILNLEQRFFLCDHNLNYTDKMSMSAGVEVRVPFLDKDLVNYVSVMPSKYKQKGKQGKWILKQIMKQYLPKDVIYRSKSGFGVPLRKWLKDELSDWLLEVLSKKNIKDRGLFNPIEVHNLIEKNKKGEVDGTYTLFSLACIEIWCRKFL